LREIFGRHTLRSGMEEETAEVGGNTIVLGSIGSAFTYRRYEGDKVASESLIVTDTKVTYVGLFPNPPIKTPKEVAKNVYIKFKSPMIIDQRSISVLYSKIPIEIGVYRQHEDEEFLIDVFSLARQRYALYGSPESGVVCRFIEAEAVTDKSTLDVRKYEEAMVRIRVNNGIDNVIKVSKIIIPVEDVVLEHKDDDVWVPGSVEMALDTAFGKDVVTVRLTNTRVKRRDKTSAKKIEETLVFLMDAGY